MDRFAAMSTLLAAVDGGSLSAASRSLGMPMATVSRRVSDLETHLRARLLVRTSRKLALTDVGQAYVDAARRILDELDDAERAAAGEYRVPSGHLTIATPVMFGRLHVEPVVLDFLKVYPDITARLALADEVVSLVDEHVDVAVRIGALPDSGMVAIGLGEIGWVACASPSYLADRGAPGTVDDLAVHDLIAFKGLYAPNAWRFGRGKAQVTLPIRPRLAVNSAIAAIDAAIAGAGVTRVLSYQVAEAVASGDLKLILRAFEPDRLPVHLLHSGPPRLPLKLRAFLDFTAPRIRTSLARIAL